jgi:hypothetical protein
MRTVIEQPSVSASVDDAQEKWPRAYDAWESVTWLLARDPEIGIALTESGRTRALTFEGVNAVGMPTITLVYEIEERAVIIHQAHFKSASHNEAGRA